MGGLMDWSSVDTTWKGHEYFAQWLIGELDPKVTVEIGTYTGFSTYFLAKNNKGTVYTIDIEEYGAEENLSELDNVVFLTDGSEDTVKIWTDKIDLLHIDGNHMTEGIQHDLTEWLPHMNVNGVILMHDVFTNAWLPPFTEFMNLRVLDKKGANLRKRFFLNNQGLGILTFNDDIIMKMDEKYKTLIVSDHNMANIVNFINYHSKRLGEKK